MHLQYCAYSIIFIVGYYPDESLPPTADDVGTAISNMPLASWTQPSPFAESPCWIRISKNLPKVAYAAIAIAFATISDTFNAVAGNAREQSAPHGVNMFHA